MTSSVNYRSMPLPRVLLPVVLVLVSIVGVLFVVTAVRGSGPPVAFLVFWLAAFYGNVYWWGWRVCAEVGVDGVTLTWRTALLSRQAPVADVVRVRPSRMNRQMAAIELQGRRPLIVPVRYGFGELTQAIAAAAPHAAIDGA